MKSRNLVEELSRVSYKYTYPTPYMHNKVEVMRPAIVRLPSMYISQDLLSISRTDTNNKQKTHQASVGREQPRRENAPPPPLSPLNDPQKSKKKKV